MSFKIGQKVVYTPQAPMPTTMITPKEGEIVTIHSFCEVYKGSIDISEYLFGKNGLPQSFHPRHFRPLDYAFVEEVIKQVQPEKQPA